MNRVKKIIIGVFLFAICILLFQFFNNGKNIIEGHGGGGGGGRGGGFGGGGPGGGGFGGRGFGHGPGWRGTGYYGNNNYYYGVGGAYVNPVYICDEDNDSDICRGRYYGIFY